jgi:hypothetical protein
MCKLTDRVHLTSHDSFIPVAGTRHGLRERRNWCSFEARAILSGDQAKRASSAKNLEVAGQLQIRFGAAWFCQSRSSLLSDPTPPASGCFGRTRAALRSQASTTPLPDLAYRAPCHRVRKLVASKLVALEAQLRELRSWRAELHNTLAQWDRLLAKTPRGKQARLLEAFAATHPKSHIRNSRFCLVARGNQKREKQR